MSVRRPVASSDRHDASRSLPSLMCLSSNLHDRTTLERRDAFLPGGVDSSERPIADLLLPTAMMRRCPGKNFGFKKECFSNDYLPHPDLVIFMDSHRDKAENDRPDQDDVSKWNARDVIWWACCIRMCLGWRQEGGEESGEGSDEESVEGNDEESDEESERGSSLHLEKSWAAILSLYARLLRRSIELSLRHTFTPVEQSLIDFAKRLCTDITCTTVKYVFNGMDDTKQQHILSDEGACMKTRIFLKRAVGTSTRPEDDVALSCALHASKWLENVVYNYDESRERATPATAGVASSGILDRLYCQYARVDPGLYLQLVEGLLHWPLPLEPYEEGQLEYGLSSIVTGDQISANENWLVLFRKMDSVYAWTQGGYLSLMDCLLSTKHLHSVACAALSMETNVSDYRNMWRESSAYFGAAVEMAKKVAPSPYGFLHLELINVPQMEFVFRTTGGVVPQRTLQFDTSETGQRYCIVIPLEPNAKYVIQNVESPLLQEDTNVLAALKPLVIELSRGPQGFCLPVALQGCVIVVVNHPQDCQTTIQKWCQAAFALLDLSAAKRASNQDPSLADTDEERSHSSFQSILKYSKDIAASFGRYPPGQRVSEAGEIDAVEVFDEGQVLPPSKSLPLIPAYLRLDYDQVRAYYESEAVEQEIRNSLYSMHPLLAAYMDQYVGKAIYGSSLNLTWTCCCGSLKDIMHILRQLSNLFLYETPEGKEAKGGEPKGRKDLLLRAAINGLLLLDPPDMPLITTSHMRRPGNVIVLPYSVALLVSIGALLKGPMPTKADMSIDGPCDVIVHGHFGQLSKMDNIWTKAVAGFEGSAWIYDKYKYDLDKVDSNFASGIVDAAHMAALRAIGIVGAKSRLLQLSNTRSVDAEKLAANLVDISQHVKSACVVRGVIFPSIYNTFIKDMEEQEKREENSEKGFAAYNEARTAAGAAEDAAQASRTRATEAASAAEAARQAVELAAERAKAADDYLFGDEGTDADMNEELASLQAVQAAKAAAEAAEVAASKAAEEATRNAELAETKAERIMLATAEFIEPGYLPTKYKKFVANVFRIHISKSSFTWIRESVAPAIVRIEYALHHAKGEDGIVAQACKNGFPYHLNWTTQKACISAYHKYLVDIERSQDYNAIVIDATHALAFLEIATQGLQGGKSSDGRPAFNGQPLVRLFNILDTVGDEFRTSENYEESPQLIFKDHGERGAQDVMRWSDDEVRVFAENLLRVTSDMYTANDVSLRRINEFEGPRELLNANMCLPVGTANVKVEENEWIFSEYDGLLFASSAASVQKYRMSTSMKSMTNIVTNPTKMWVESSDAYSTFSGWQEYVSQRYKQLDLRDREESDEEGGEEGSEEGGEEGSEKGSEKDDE